MQGTSTGWASINVKITLEAGEYTLACAGASAWDYGVQVTGGFKLQAPSDTRPVTGTLTAGEYNCELFVSGGKTVDLDLTPTLTKTK